MSKKWTRISQYHATAPNGRTYWVGNGMLSLEDKSVPIQPTLLQKIRLWKSLKKQLGASHDL